MGKQRSFFFHYNKPASRKHRKVQVSLHYRGTCYVVDNIICNVPTTGKIRKSQPYWVIVGKCISIEIENGIAVIS